jgi:phage terminase small subunit
MALTPKRQRFAQEYVVDLNATQAAIRAGFAASGAAVEGARLLRNPKVGAEISRLQAQRNERTQISADRVLAELARIAFSDMRRFVKWGANGIELVESEALNDDDARCVAEVSRSADGGSVKFKLHDKTAALERIGRHLGMFTEKMEHQLLLPEMTREERADRVAALLSIGRQRALAATNGTGDSNG